MSQRAFKTGPKALPQWRDGQHGGRQVPADDTPLLVTLTDDAHDHHLDGPIRAAPTEESRRNHERQPDIVLAPVDAEPPVYLPDDVQKKPENAWKSLLPYLLVAAIAVSYMLVFNATEQGRLGSAPTETLRKALMELDRMVPTVERENEENSIAYLQDVFEHINSRPSKAAARLHLVGTSPSDISDKASKLIRAFESLVRSGADKANCVGAICNLSEKYILDSSKSILEQIGEVRFRAKRPLFVLNMTAPGMTDFAVNSLAGSMLDDTLPQVNYRGANFGLRESVLVIISYLPDLSRHGLDTQEAIDTAVSDKLKLTWDDRIRQRIPTAFLL